MRDEARADATDALRQLKELGVEGVMLTGDNARTAAAIAGNLGIDFQADRSTRPDDEVLRARVRELADQRRRFGYRRLHVLLRQDGHLVNRKKTQRLYREEWLMVRRRKSRRRIAVARTPIPLATSPNSHWSVDFLYNQLANGRLATPARFALKLADSFRRRFAHLRCDAP